MAAAVASFHENGVARTSLAQVAERAGVPAGNVFYYFRTKDELIRAVAAEWRRLLGVYLQSLDERDDPRARLDGFLDAGAEAANVYAARGCPLAGLVRDLRQENPALADEAPSIYAVQGRWIARQFAEAGFDAGKPDELARTFLARYHGAVHLTYADGDPARLIEEVARLRTWLWTLPIRP